MSPSDSPSLQPARTTSSASTRYGRLTPPQYGNAFVPSVDATLDPFGLWRSLVARSVRVGEVAGSNPVSPMGLGARIWAHRGADAGGSCVCAPIRAHSLANTDAPTDAPW